jgi:Werner syndrome ATP-dependent helicase
MTDIYDTTLQQYFGYDKLKDLQKNVIKTIIEDKNDVLGVLATGYGKSICYQLPFLILNKPIIVISPLLALMEDQKINLEEKNIPVTCLNSNMSTKIKEYEKNQILEGEYKIIYIAPESVNGLRDFIVTLYKEHDMPFIAIDESHCISSWGNDFRPDYKNLSCLKDWMPNIKIMALTATATPKVRLDIKESLKMKNPREIISSFDRYNLYIKCTRKTDDIENDIRELVNNNRETFTIVYVRTRELTETLSKIINKMGITCYAFHAGLNVIEKQKIQNDFHNGKFKWIIATIAFGMGIDQNIHLIIHYGSPPDVESYYQEIGRAGRDNKQAECHLFYGKDDMRINRILLKDIKNMEYKKFRENQIRTMERFASITTCRKQLILEYFGEKKGQCKKCDNCCSVIQDTTKINNDIQYPVFLILKLMFDIKKKIGKNKIITILLGKKDNKIKEFFGLELYGLGKKYPKEYWEIIIQILLHNGYLEEETIKSGFGTMLKTTLNTLNWFKKVDKSITNYNYENMIFYLLDNVINLDISQVYIIPLNKYNIVSNIEFSNIEI